VTVDAKLMLTNALFLFIIFIVQSSRYFHRAILLPQFSFCGTTTEYRIDTKSLVTVTFLLFIVSSCPKATGVPSPTISMVQRTALRLLVNFLPKQVTGIHLWLRLNSGLF